MREVYENNWYYIQIALGGVTGRVPNNHGPPGVVECYDKHLSHYFGDLAEGGLVIDKRTVGNREVLIKLILSDEFMVNASLPEMTVERGLFNPERVEIQSRSEMERGDYIPLHLYAQIWEERGARIGKRVGNEIVWNDGEKRQIPPASERYTAKDDWVPKSWGL